MDWLPSVATKVRIKSCKVTDCENPNKTRVILGLCNKHYKRYKKHGTYNEYIQPNRTGDRLSYTPEYRIWAGIKSRTINKNNRFYQDYGGRGIILCEKRQDFDSFIRDVGKRPGEKLTLDRIDNDGNYEPGNVRWTTTRVQNINQRVRKDNTTGYKGIYRAGDRWRVRIGSHGKVLNLGVYESLQKAIQVRKNAESTHFSEALSC